MIQISPILRRNMLEKLQILYGTKAEITLHEIEALIIEFKDKQTDEYLNLDKNVSIRDKISHKDVVLITYANSIQGKTGSPFQALNSVTSKSIQRTINVVHVLPFYTWDTDRGFSVVDYYEVDPRNGTWNDFDALRTVFPKRMVDCVVNHASIDNPLIQKALIGDDYYKDFVIKFSDDELPSKEHIHKLARPRATPVLTRYFILNCKGKVWASFNEPSSSEHETKIIDRGWVWTTFSRPNLPTGEAGTRQVDLNFHEPKVLIEMLRIMLHYVSNGASWLRLDAICYAWKHLGTTSIHLPNTHLIVQFFYDFFQAVAPSVVMVAEVNEPQKNVVAYLGDSTRTEADLIYQFTHFPLAIHAIITGNAEYYLKWLSTVKAIHGRAFITVMGSHDGMGWKPVKGLLPDNEIQLINERLISKHGALPNYARLPGGKKIVYEICATPWNLINPLESNESRELQIKRYIAVLALGLVVRGVPALYITGLLGLSNNSEELDENRTINRQIINEDDLINTLNDPSSLTSQVFEATKNILAIRIREKAFNPLGPPMKVLNLNHSIVAGVLSSTDKSEHILFLVNVCKDSHRLIIDLKNINLATTNQFFELISNTVQKTDSKTRKLELNIDPYQICWLKFKTEL